MKKDKTLTDIIREVTGPSPVWLESTDINEMTGSEIRLYKNNRKNDVIKLTKTQQEAVNNGLGLFIQNHEVYHYTDNALLNRYKPEERPEPFHYASENNKNSLGQYIKAEHIAYFPKQITVTMPLTETQMAVIIKEIRLTRKNSKLEMADDETLKDRKPLPELPKTIDKK